MGALPSNTHCGYGLGPAAPTRFERVPSLSVVNISGPKPQTAYVKT